MEHKKEYEILYITQRFQFKKAILNFEDSGL